MTYRNCPHIPLCTTNSISINSLELSKKQLEIGMVTLLLRSSEKQCSSQMMIFHFQLYIIFSSVVCLITGIRVMIENHCWRIVNISAWHPLILITVSDNTPLKLETTEPIREQQIAVFQWKRRKASDIWRHEREISLSRDEVSAVSLN